MNSLSLLKVEQGARNKKECKEAGISLLNSKESLLSRAKTSLMHMVFMDDGTGGSSYVMPIYEPSDFVPDPQATKQRMEELARIRQRD